jgi:transcriptional regulator with XRE-family HTH domain
METGAPELRWLGIHIRSVRTGSGLSQAELAERCSLSEVQIAQFESGRRQPSLEQFLVIARAFGVPLQRLLAGADRPGEGLQDICFELRRLGIVDLRVEGATVPGAARRPEEVIALALAGPEPDPRIIEAIPAVLAWNKINPVLLRAFGTASRTTIRMAWLADVVLSIEQGGGFPGGCTEEEPLARFLQVLGPRKPLEETDEWDDLGKPSAVLPPSPIWRRWRIKYDVTLDQFEARARHLAEIRRRQRLNKQVLVRSQLKQIRETLEQQLADLSNHPTESNRRSDSGESKRSEQASRGELSTDDTDGHR